MLTTAQTICSICEGTTGKAHMFREMMFGTRDQFEYWECDSCGCLQIAQIPEKLADYYPSDYYSFAQELDKNEASFYKIYFKAPFLAPVLRRLSKNPYFADGKFQSIVAAKPKKHARILDVGCGGGHLVSVLRMAGFDAHGIDAFAQHETEYIHRATLDEVSGGWDLITFHHCLEHMSNHVDVLTTAREKLAEGGTVLIRIPVAAWAWKEYGANWVQLDAPRHLVIHTEQSLKQAAEAAGMELVRTDFDSTIFQHVGSELYKRDLPLSEMGKETARMPREIIAGLSSRTAELNRDHQGDQASFFLKAAKVAKPVTRRAKPAVADAVSPAPLTDKVGA
jgi:SAM-dependent methyltransferase